MLHSIRTKGVKGQAAVQDLSEMSRLEILGPHLARAAFREHGCLMDAAVECEDWPLAECILQQVKEISGLKALRPRFSGERRCMGCC